MEYIFSLGNIFCFSRNPGSQQILWSETNKDLGKVSKITVLTYGTKFIHGNIYVGANSDIWTWIMLRFFLSVSWLYRKKWWVNSLPSWLSLSLEVKHIHLSRILYCNGVKRFFAKQCVARFDRVIVDMWLKPYQIIIFLIIHYSILCVRHSFICCYVLTMVSCNYRYGDMRHVMSFELVRMWNSLGEA